MSGAKRLSQKTPRYETFTYYFVFLLIKIIITGHHLKNNQVMLNKMDLTVDII